jgi:hypothetical protein
MFTALGGMLTLASIVLASPSVHLSASTVVPADHKAGEAAYSIRLGLHWARTPGGTSYTLTDPVSGQKLGVMAVICVVDSPADLMASTRRDLLLERQRRSKMVHPIPSPLFSGALDRFGMFQHEKDIVTLYNRSCLVDIEANYSPRMTRPEYDELVAMAQSLRVLTPPRLPKTRTGIPGLK